MASDGVFLLRDSSQLVHLCNTANAKSQIKSIAATTTARESPRYLLVLTYKYNLNDENSPDFEKQMYPHNIADANKNTKQT